MTSWWVEPRDPLVVRDGRPNDGRSMSGTLPFPHPSFVAGIARTRLGSSADGSFVYGDRLDRLRATRVCGPLLGSPVRKTWWVPAPRDAVIVETPTGAWALRRAAPAPVARDERVDRGLPPGQSLVAVVGRVAGKPPHKLPRFWPWPAFEEWLVDPAEVLRRHGSDCRTWLADGLEALDQEARLHVAMTPLGTAKDGALFGVRGLRFVRSTAPATELALWVDLESGGLGELRPGIGPAGGERRLVRWTPCVETLPGVPPALRPATTSGSVVRVVLITPAIFEAGWSPSPSGPVLGGGQRLVGAAVPRPETISGWDLAKGGPKASRRMVPAGSVFWIELGGTPEERSEWIERRWMTNVSDDEQDRNDGFGLVAVGVGE